MSLLAPAAAAAAANAIAGLVGYTSLHSASPSTTGANEIGGTSVRVATAWSTATSGAPIPSNSGALSLVLPSSTTTTHLGGWTALTGGAFTVGFVLGSSITSGATAATITAAIGAVTLPVT